MHNYEGKFSSDFRFDVSALESGVYLINISTELGNKTCKLIKSN